MAKRPRQRRCPMSPTHPRWSDFRQRVGEALVQRGRLGCNGSFDCSRRVLKEWGFDTTAIVASLHSLQQSGRPCDCRVAAQVETKSKAAVATRPTEVRENEDLDQEDLDQEDRDRETRLRLPWIRRPIVRLDWREEDDRLLLIGSDGRTYGHVEPQGHRFAWVCYPTQNDPSAFGQGLEECLRDACVCLLSDAAALLIPEGYGVEQSMEWPGRDAA